MTGGRQLVREQDGNSEKIVINVDEWGEFLLLFLSFFINLLLFGGLFSRAVHNRIIVIDITAVKVQWLNKWLFSIHSPWMDFTQPKMVHKNKNSTAIKFCRAIQTRRTTLIANSKLCMQFLSLPTHLLSGAPTVASLDAQ